MEHGFFEPPGEKQIGSNYREVSAVARPNGQPRQAGVARGVRGNAPPPREILNFSLSEMRFAAFSGPKWNLKSNNQKQVT